MAVDWIQIIADDNRLFHDGPIGILEGLPGWGSGAAYPETTLQPSGWTAYVPWAHLSRDATGAFAPLSAADQARPWLDPRARTGNQAPNTRAHLRHHQMLWLLSNGTWVLDNYTDTIGRRLYPYSWIEGTDYDAPDQIYRNELSGGSSLRALGLGNDPRNPANPNEFRDRTWHPFASRRPIPANWVGFVAVVFGRLILDDPLQADDRGQCNILCGTSFDWYLAMTLPSPPEQNVNVLYGGFSRLKYLRNEWQIFCNTNLSEAQLRANPPPIVGVGLLEPFVPPTPVVTPAGPASSRGRWIDVYRPSSPVGRWADLAPITANVAPIWSEPPPVPVQVVTGNTFLYPPTLLSGTLPITYSKASGLSWATVNAITGAVGGTAGATGTGSVVVRATNAWGQADFTLLIDVVASGSAVAPTITTTTLPVLTAGIGGSIPISITGSGAFALSTSAGTPPPGTTYVGQNIVVPISAPAGVYSWTVTATGPTSLTDTQAYTLTLALGDAPQITTQTLPSARVGTAYSQALTAVGVPPFTWTVTNGDLPTGIFLNSLTGAFAGTPTLAGTASFEVRAGNVVGTAAQTFSLLVEPALTVPNITTTLERPVGTVGTLYSDTIYATGSTPILWTVSAGTLPAGLALDATTGAITGTPTTAETSTVTLQATNSVGADSQTFIYSVLEVAVSPVIITASPLNAGTVGSSYSQTFAATGTLPITWSIQSGALPAGLTLNSTTGQVSGIPTTDGAAAFVTRATNAAGYVSMPFQITINPAAELPPLTSGVAAAGTSFKVELLQAVHNFSVSGDTFKLALYSPAASLSIATTTYTTQNEVVGPGYTPGGVTLTNVSPVVMNNVAVATFADVLFPVVSITVRYAMIYNASKANRMVAVLDFGQSYTIDSGNFEILMPSATATNAIIRVT